VDLVGRSQRRPSGRSIHLSGAEDTEHGDVGGAFFVEHCASVRSQKCDAVTPGNRCGITLKCIRHASRPRRVALWRHRMPMTATGEGTPIARVFRADGEERSARFVL
jgi:hypothetical protein